MSKTGTDIIDWFDIHNIEHLKAYKCLADTGTWPIGFLPATGVLKFPAGWQCQLAFMLARAYIDQQIWASGKD